MSKAQPPGKEAETDIQTALVGYSFLAIEAEAAHENLVNKIQTKLRRKPELKRALESQAEDLLTCYRNEILAFGIIDAVKKALEDALHESKWTKWALVVSQALGLAAAASLLRHYSSLPPDALWPLAAYSFFLLVTIGIGIFRGR
jgi:hypothetical protein